jgi:hypothetical protein
MAVPAPLLANARVSLRETGQYRLSVERSDRSGPCQRYSLPIVLEALATLSGPPAGSDCATQSSARLLSVNAPL